MRKHTLQIEYDFDFLLIGISSHEKDYRLAWAINKAFEIDLSKQDSLEIKGKKQETPSYFSFFLYEDVDAFKEYAVIANLSESKEASTNSLFKENEFLIPEQKQMNYFLICRGEFDDDEKESVLKMLRDVDIVQTASIIDAKSLKTKQNLVF